MHSRPYRSWVAAIVATGLALARPLCGATDDAAINPTLTVSSELWQNVKGGAQTGNWWNTLLDFGLEIHTAKLGGPPNSSVFGQVRWLKNRRADHCFADDTGARNPVSNIMASDQLRVFDLYYRQSWRDNAYAFKLGQLALDDDFMHSDYAALFLNSAFGAMPAQVGTSLSAHCGHASAFPIYAVASPGVWLHARLARSFDWQTGVYYGGPGYDTDANHGFSWQGASHSGVAIFTEGDWSYPLDRHSAVSRFGYSYHNGLFDDYRAIEAGRTNTITRGLYSFYFVQDLVLVTTDLKQPKLAAFGRVGLSPQQDRSVAATYVDSGFNWFGPLPGRPEDVAGAGISSTRFGRHFRTVAGVATSETTTEFTYKAKLTRWFTIQADMQFLFHLAPNPRSGTRETATVLGLRTVITF
ncbi:MAG: carbohydrate porin [Verrucomicrobiota bacterium]|nr:carbohydrate porin [Verrucomicrobiota bacterium]